MRGAPIGAHRQCCGTAAWPRHTRSNGREERPAAWKWCTAHHGTRLDVSHSSVRSRIGRRRGRRPASRRLEYWRRLQQRAENCEPDRLRRKWRSGEKCSATVCLLQIQIASEMCYRRGTPGLEDGTPGLEDGTPGLELGRTSRHDSSGEISRGDLPHLPAVARLREALRCSTNEA